MQMPSAFCSSCTVREGHAVMQRVYEQQQPCTHHNTKGATSCHALPYLHMVSCRACWGLLQPGRLPAVRRAAAHHHLPGGLLYVRRHPDAGAGAQADAAMHIPSLLTEAAYGALTGERFRHQRRFSSSPSPHHHHLVQYCWYELPKSRRCVPVHLRTFQPSRPRPGRSAHPELSRLGPYVR